MPVTVKTRQPVEQWMGQLEAKSNVAVSKALKLAIEESDEVDDNKKRGDWVLQQANKSSQALCVAASINWCYSTEVMLQDLNPIENILFWYDENVEALESLTALVRRDLTMVQR